MAYNLVNQLKELINQAFVNTSASKLNEDNIRVQNGVNAIIPTILYSVLTKSKFVEPSISHLLFDQFDGHDEDNLIDYISTISAPSNGLNSMDTELVNNLWGDTHEDIAVEISRFSGLKLISVQSLVAIILPFVLNYLKRFFIHSNIKNDAEIRHFMGMQQSNIMASFPHGLNLGHIMTGNTLGEPLTSPENPFTDVAEHTPGSRGKGFLWLLLLLFLGFMLWWLLGKNGCRQIDYNVQLPNIINDSPQVHKDTRDEKSKLDAHGNYIWDVGKETIIKLNDSVELNVGENSTEAKLYKFLVDNDAKISDDKTIGWITLDRVYFENGKDVLIPASELQLKNIALILSQFPNAHVKLGGYTDNSGTDNINIPLSQKRAEMARQRLINLGIRPQQVTAKGYGSEYPLCLKNDTDACKAQNRRVDIRVEKK